MPINDKSIVKVVVPPNVAWLEYKLDSVELDYVWERIKEAESSNISHKPKLVGDIHESKLLKDPDDWIFNTTILKLCHVYSDIYENMGNNLPVAKNHNSRTNSLEKRGGEDYPYFLREWWVNYQYQNEFNPVHNHTGVYSFVLWLQIPTDHEEQNKDNTSNIKLRSSFQFTYSDLLGKFRTHNYDLDKSWEGTMLFFPSKLIHQVYPFYNNDDARISVSGNILCKI